MAGDRQDNNLLVNLRRWARRQDENFLTEAFAHLLRHLCCYEPDVAVSVLRSLTSFQITLKDIARIRITSQVDVERGRPDLEILAPGHFRIFVEAKVESGLREKQIAQYQQALKSDPAPQKALILLTRYCVEPPSREGGRVICRRWHEIAEWLRIENTGLHDGVSNHLVEQFIHYLEKRGIAMNRVSEDILPGTQPMLALLAMFSEALERAKAKGKIGTYREEIGADYIGYRIDKAQCYLDLWTERPNTVHFSTYYFPVREDAVDMVGFGYLYGETQKDRQWMHDFVLQSDADNFFALSPDEQMERIDAFLNECLEALPKVKAKSKK